jgi:hypothetical protein
LAKIPNQFNRYSINAIFFPKIRINESYHLLGVTRRNLLEFIDVSDEFATSIFRVEARQATSKMQQQPEILVDSLSLYLATLFPRQFL